MLRVCRNAKSLRAERSCACSLAGSFSTTAGNLEEAAASSSSPPPSLLLQQPTDLKVALLRPSWLVSPPHPLLLRRTTDSKLALLWPSWLVTTLGAAHIRQRAPPAATLSRAAPPLLLLQ
ncbi:hypothetical protein MRX96_053766 [Rhipicephalus microplus]